MIIYLSTDTHSTWSLETKLYYTMQTLSSSLTSPSWSFWIAPNTNAIYTDSPKKWYIQGLTFDWFHSLHLHKIQSHALFHDLHWEVQVNRRAFRTCIERAASTTTRTHSLRDCLINVSCFNVAYHRDDCSPTNRSARMTNFLVYCYEQSVATRNTHMYHTLPTMKTHEAQGFVSLFLLYLIEEPNSNGDNIGLVRFGNSAESSWLTSGQPSVKNQVKQENKTLSDATFDASTIHVAVRFRSHSISFSLSLSIYIYMLFRGLLRGALDSIQIQSMPGLLPRQTSRVNDNFRITTKINSWVMTAMEWGTVIRPTKLAASREGGADILLLHFNLNSWSSSPLLPSFLTACLPASESSRSTDQPRNTSASFLFGRTQCRPLPGSGQLMSCRSPLSSHSKELFSLSR